MSDPEETKTEVTRVEGANLPVTVDENNSIGSLLRAIVKADLTQDSAAALEKMANLYRQEQDRLAKRDYLRDMAALQAEIKHVKACQSVPNNDGSIRYWYIPRSKIQEQLAPYLAKYGFSLHWDSESDGERITAICTVGHPSGHEQVSRFACRVSAPPKSSDAQADGSTLEYAKRLALCNAFDIVVDKDVDARLEGDKISPEKAEELQRRLAAVGGDAEAFLRFAGAERFADIREARLSGIEQALAGKERAAQRPAEEAPASEPSDGPDQYTDLVAAVNDAVSGCTPGLVREVIADLETSDQDITESIVRTAVKMRMKNKE